MSDDQQLPPAPPAMRVKPAGRRDQVGNDGATYRVHAFYVVNSDDQIVTDETDDGPQPIMFQSVPMRISQPVSRKRPSGLVLH